MEVSLSTPMSKKLEGKVAIITGGASGIGEATARLFAKEGAHMVVIADIQDQLGQSVASSIGAHHCTYIHCDVSDENQVKSMVESTVKSYGHLDIMFSNAGIANSSPNLLELDLSSMDRLFAVNVRGMAACVKYAARAMVESGVKGSIVCTASVAAKKGSSDGMQDYIMSKNAVLGLVRSGSCELGKYGIRINCVLPGGVATPIAMQYFGMTNKEQLEEEFSRHCSLKGLVLKVNHVADAVLYLASDQSAFVTGHDLVVDGGMLCL
ncbi:Short-chain dehydrogenase reductase 3b [Thalictrum thalictroides]|uniref:Secoisolariciresinol dehydrogenase n=1 Tax=Thalictrum thalictroides TaxID=46969 RepID=A0A7J6XGF4_THATH|nr:Short-chain dehydrogenase reductase 3b [Thalictrum thalictroides]